MLRSKIYNRKKKRGLNEFFKREYDTEDVMMYCQVNNTIIKENVNFNIIKEELLGTYIIAFKNIIIIHLDQNEYNDFVYLYKNSNEYLFDIYTSINYKKQKIYHIFCINKYLNEINYSSFIEGNECSYKYDCLIKLYGPNLVINKRFNLTEPIDKMNVKYIFVKTIGKGIVNYNIKNLIKVLIQLINTYYLEYLPINYLNI